MFLDDFTFYNDMESHLMKSKLCFQKCGEHKINLNRNKCAFMVFLGLILRFIISKEGKIPDLKKVEAIVNMPIPLLENLSFATCLMQLFCLTCNYFGVTCNMCNCMRHFLVA
jgi:hypothetical protein